MGSTFVRKDKKRRPVARPGGNFKSFANIYATTLARRVADELKQRRARPASRKKKPPS
jgi:hypothetical protein